MNGNSTELRDADAPHYGFWEALWMSFFSPKVYVDGGKRWKGYGILYFLLVIAVTSIPVAVRVGVEFNHYFNTEIVSPLESLPLLHVQNGKIIFDKPMPWRIMSSDNRLVGLIDTTGSVQRFADAPAGITILITSDALWFSPPQPRFFDGFPMTPMPRKVFVLPLDEGGTQVFDAKQWISESNMVWLKWFSMIAIYPTLVVVLFLFFGVLMIFMAFLGQLTSWLFLRFKISFRVASRLVALASTPAMLMLLSLVAANRYFEGMGLLMVVVLVVFFFFGAISLKRESMGMVPV